MSGIGGHFSYAVTIFLMVAGLFIVIARGNLIKKLVGLGHFPDLGVPALHRTGQADRRHGTDHRGWFQRVFQSLAACPDPDRHCRRRGHAGARPGADGTHSRSLRHDRGRRNPRSGITAHESFGGYQPITCRRCRWLRRCWPHPDGAAALVARGLCAGDSRQSWPVSPFRSALWQPGRCERHRFPTPWAVGSRRGESNTASIICRHSCCCWSA